MKSSEIRQFVLKAITVGMGTGCIVAGIFMTYQGKAMVIANISIAAGLVFLIAGLILITVALVKGSIKIWHILLLIVIVVLIVYISTRYTLKETDKYDILVDLIFIVLAFTGAVGYGVYSLIRRDVEARTREVMTESNNVTGAGVHASLGYVWYRHHEASRQASLSRQKKPIEKEDSNDNVIDYLQFAIDEGRIALKYANKLDEQRHEELICACKNNLAYYLAEKYRMGKPVSRGDKELAFAYAEYIREKIQKYPSRRAAWSHTYDFVKSHFTPTEGIQDNKT